MEKKVTCVDPSYREYYDYLSPFGGFWKVIGRRSCGTSEKVDMQSENARKLFKLEIPDTVVFDKDSPKP